MRRRRRRPTQLKKFGDRTINLHDIERHYGLSRTYLSRIFFGSIVDGELTFRSPSLEYGQKIAESLNLSLSRFLSLLRAHQAVLLQAHRDKKLAEQDEILNSSVA